MFGFARSDRHVRASAEGRAIPCAGGRGHGCRRAALRFAPLLPLLHMVPPANATEAENRVTSIENKACTFAPTGDPDDQSKRCPGLGGAIVLVSAFETRVRIGFDWRGNPAVKPVPAVVEAWSAGEKIDWRGRTGPAGFVPYAATVRMLFPKDDGPQVGHQVLAVMRVGHGDACLVGVVDLQLNADGYDLARGLADEAPGFTYGKDRERAAGAESEWTKRLLQPISN